MRERWPSSAARWDEIDRQQRGGESSAGEQASDLLHPLRDLLLVHRAGPEPRSKRHLFLCLGEQLCREGLRPPKCDDCGDYEACVGAAETPGRKAWPLTPSA